MPEMTSLLEFSLSLVTLNTLRLSVWYKYWPKQGLLHQTPRNSCLKSVRRIGLNPAAQQREGWCGSLQLGPCWARAKDHLLSPSAPQDSTSLCCHVSRNSLLEFVKPEIMHSCNMSHPSANIRCRRTDVGKGRKKERILNVLPRISFYHRASFLAFPFKQHYFPSSTFAIFSRNIWWNIHSCMLLKFRNQNEKSLRAQKVKSLKV